jgi:hypothetical protein
VLVLYLKADEKGFKSAFKKAIDAYNLALKAHTPMLLPIPHSTNHFFNVTNMYAPILDSETQIAEVAIDGTVFDTYLKTCHVDPTTTKAQMVAEYPGSQIFIHQSAFASYFYSVYDKIMPIRIDDISSSLEIIAEFPEIKAAYGGHGTAVNMSITVSPASGKFLSFSRSQGIVFGQQDALYLTMEFYCSNESQNRTSELCVVFDIQTHFWFNVTVDNWDLYFMINDAILDSVTISKDNIGMKDRDYKRVLQHILNYAIANYNYVSSGAISLNTTIPIEPLLKEFVTL